MKRKPEKSWWICENCWATARHSHTRSLCRCGWWMRHATPKEARETEKNLTDLRDSL